jgi:aminomethyltransferase
LTSNAKSNCSSSLEGNFIQILLFFIKLGVVVSNLLKTSLYEKHINLGAKMAPFAGHSMPLQYSSAKEEVAAVRNNVGVFDVSHMGEFFVSGEEALEFVDYVMCNDFKNSKESKAVYSPLLREDGTIIDDLIAYKLDDNNILICVNAANIEKDWEWLSEKSKNFNCKLVDKSKEYSLLAVQGPKVQSLFEKIELLEVGEDFPYYSVKSKSINSERLIIARTGYTGEDGFEIFCSHSTVQNLWDKLIEHGCKPCGLSARDILRLEVCYPLYGNELTDKITPLDSGLKWTVKFEKDNFIGQKTLENYKPKFRLVKLSIDKGIPREGYEILNSEENVIGSVTSGTMSLTLGKGIALALIQKELFPIDKKFFIKVRKNNLEAHYHTKPFVTGGHK